MKSKRVTKLLACVLATSMCAVPVAAASSDTKPITDDKEYTLDVDFGVNSPVIDVTVPTKADVKVNPYNKTTNTGALNEFTVASKELVISNNTKNVDDGTGVALLCTVRGTITNTAEGVGVSYNTFVPKAGSEKKLIHLDLTSANTASGTQSENNTFGGTTAVTKVPMTKVGSRLQLPISASSNTAPGYGAFAVTGTANVAAEWADTDVNVSLSYRVRAIQEAPVNNPNISAVTVTSANVANQATQIATITETEMGDGVSVTGVIIHSPENEFEDYPLTSEQLDITQDATNGYVVKIKAADPGLTFLGGASFKGKGQDLLIGLSDGRIMATDRKSVV